MAIHQTIKEEIKTAMRAHDSVRLNTLRNLAATFLNEMIAAKSVSEFLPDEKALPLIKRSINQHKDSIDQYTKGNRPDLVAIEQTELKILDEFMPTQMTKDAIRTMALTRIEQMKKSGEFDPRLGGRIMGIIMKDLAGQADGNDVKVVVDELLKSDLSRGSTS